MTHARSICICGSRMFWPTRHSEMIRDAVLALVGRIKSHGDTLIVGGCPSGPDEWSLSEAKRIGCGYRVFPAGWNAYGKSAGMKRNARMRSLADEVHAFWDGQSPGTHDMVFATEPAKLYVYHVDDGGVSVFLPPNALSESTEWLMEKMD